MAQGPTLACEQVGDFEPRDLVSVRAAFAGRDRCVMGQKWLPFPEAGFRSASVRVGRRDDGLIVFAELDDDDILTEASAPNQRFWELGDTFEMFFQAPGASHYVELQLTPTGLPLQLRIPIPRPRSEPEALMVPETLFRGQAWVEARHWAALAFVPYSPIGGRPERFSFSRYDYTRGRAEPVLSSTSPHDAADFHRREEWGTLTFP